MIGKRAGAKTIVLSLCASVALAGTLDTGAAQAKSKKGPTKYSQPTCGKLKAKAKSKKGSKHDRSMAKYWYNECRNNRKAWNEIRDSYFVGTRTDDVEIDTIYCTNGKVQDDVTTNPQTYTKGWHVVGAKFAKNGKDFTAAAEALLSVSPVGNTKQIQIGLFTQGFIKTKGDWQVGWATGGYDVGKAGDVVKTNAREACSKL